MITNFTEVTAELNQKELNLIPVLVKCFAKYTKEKPIKTPEVVEGINNYLTDKGIKLKFSGARLRKCVNFIRCNGLLPLIATSNGYYCSNDTEEIEKQIKSLNERARSIKNCADGLYKFIV